MNDILLSGRITVTRGIRVKGEWTIEATFENDDVKMTMIYSNRDLSVAVRDLETNFVADVRSMLNELKENNNES